MTNEEAINILNRELGDPDIKIFLDASMALKMAIKALEQESKTGHWIDTGSGQKCSKCHEIQYGYDNHRFYCANCGIKMIEPQERSGEE